MYANNCKKLDFGPIVIHHHVILLWILSNNAYQLQILYKNKKICNNKILLTSKDRRSVLRVIVSSDLLITQF